MRILAICLLPFLVFCYCSSSNEDSNLIEAGSIMATNTADTCFCESLEEDSAGNLLLDSVLYTGVCIYNYPGTDAKYMVKSLLNGKLHGQVSYYDQLGEILMQEMYENGQKKRSGDGAPQHCNCSELKQVNSPGEAISRSFLDDIPFTGTCTEKYVDSDQTYMEVNYNSGLIDGFTTFYDRAGKTLYMEKYEKGKLVKVIYD